MKIKICALLVSLSVISYYNVPAQNGPDNGKAIFSSRCAACHNVNKVATGPALAGVGERRSTEWIVSFVHSPQEMISKGDPDAIAVYEKFNKIPMPAHPDLTDENIKDILAYIEAETKPVAAGDAPFARPATRKEDFRPVSVKTDWEFLVTFFGAVIVLIGTLLFAAQVRELRTAADNHQNK